MKISRRNTMKLTKSQLKQIIKEELTSQVNKINETTGGGGVGPPTDTADTPPAPVIRKDVANVGAKLDALSALEGKLAMIDTPIEVIQFMQDIVGRLDPQKVTSQELKAAMRPLFKAVMAGDLTAGR
jgi:hypothetical protein